MDEVWGTRFVSAAAVSSRIRSAGSIHTVHGRGFESIAKRADD